MRPSWRSLLFVPADSPARIEKAARSAADAIILDLEDGVAPENKSSARCSIESAVGLLRTADKDIVIRINAKWRDATADLEAGLIPGVTAVMVPKVETSCRLSTLAAMIAEWEADRGFFDTAIIALIESAAGLGALDSVSRSSRVSGLALGPEDFAATIGVAPSPELLDFPCRRIALAAASAGISAFATPVSIGAFQDDIATRAAASAAKAYGVGGALCIHPRQVAIANDVFCPSLDELRDARAVAAAWTAAGAGGVAVLDGRMIDAPVAKRALNLLRRAGEMEGSA